MHAHAEPMENEQACRAGHARVLLLQHFEAVAFEGHHVEEPTGPVMIGLEGRRP